MNKIIYIIICGWLIVSCSGSKTQEDQSHEPTEASTYTCPMHPQVVQDKPGTCPVCGMDLVAKTAHASNMANSLMLNESQLRLANITIQKVGITNVGQTTVINGKLATNEDQSEVISTRAAGRIENLYIKETGMRVRKGEPLYELYSESLLTLQREYLLAKEQAETLGGDQPRYISFAKAAEAKLLLYGLTKDQITQLSNTKLAQNRITFLSPTTGIVTELNAAEGQYLAEGNALYKIENVSSLWLEAELYPAETGHAKIGDLIGVRITGFESTEIKAKIIFLSPEYRANTQIIIMRAEINNTNLLFKPGMQAQVYFSHSGKKAITIPTDAVIRNENGTHVYVQTDVNTFEPRMIKTGIEDFERVEVISGLQEGEQIAASGAYLLYSELILKKGSDPSAPHQH
jgi:Cu(I)/Ag(I) efflux system membrane fusion protein